MMDTILFPCVTQEAFLAEQPKLWSAVFRSDPIVEIEEQWNANFYWNLPRKTQNYCTQGGPSPSRGRIGFLLET